MFSWLTVFTIQLTPKRSVTTAKRDPQKASTLAKARADRVHAFARAESEWLDLSEELLDQLDIVIASVHSHQKLDEETMTRRIVRALESGVVDLLAHPTGRILGMRDPYPVDMERVMDAAVANRVALEINAFPDRLDLNEVYARRARDRGIPISVNTDAHRPEHLALLRYGVAQARRAWLEPENVLNTWSLERLTGWLRKRT